MVGRPQRSGSARPARSRVAGTSPHGQGHATTFAQIVADDLGVPIDDVEVVTGDTQLAPLGMDTYGSRSLAIGGIAVHRAAEKMVAKARTIAAHELEVSEEDLEYEAGTFAVKGAPDQARTIPALAWSAWTAHNLPDGMEPALDSTAVYDASNFVWPYGTHVCVVEVDTDTGQLRGRQVRGRRRRRGPGEPADRGRSTPWAA